jgi:hypothetical protein
MSKTTMRLKAARRAQKLRQEQMWVDERRIADAHDRKDYALNRADPHHARLLQPTKEGTNLPLPLCGCGRRPVMRTSVDGIRRRCEQCWCISVASYYTAPRKLNYLPEV